MQSHSTESFPTLPKKFSLPLKIIPAFIHNKALISILNKVFQQDIKEGELDFLQDKIMQISIKDAGIQYIFSLDENRLIAVTDNQQANIQIEGSVYDYLLLASRKEDTDALFFSRRLKMQGDTELGLHVKNFLDGLDMDTHKIPAKFEILLKKSLPVYERLFR